MNNDRDRNRFAASSSSQQRPFRVRPSSTMPTAFFSHEVQVAVMEVQGGIEHLLGMYRAGMEAEAALRSMGIDPNNPRKAPEQPAPKNARQLSVGSGLLDGRVIELRRMCLMVGLNGVVGNYEASISLQQRGAKLLRAGDYVRVSVGRVYATCDLVKLNLNLIGVL